MCRVGSLASLRIALRLRIEAPMSSAPAAVRTLVLLTLGAVLMAGDQAGERIPLWPGPAPIGDGRSEASSAAITVHRPAHPNGTALVICPGGGYGGLVTGPEGHGIADWLGGHGITGVVLEYRLPAGRPMVPLLDAQRALRLV